MACQWFLVIFWGVHSRGVLVELCRRGLKSSTLFKTWLTSLPCLRFWFWFVSFYVKNQVVFQTNITEVVTLEKSYWYCECKLLIASLYSLSKASSPKRHCSRPLIVKFYTLFNTQNLVFSSPYLACISQIRECSPPTSKQDSLVFQVCVLRYIQVEMAFLATVLYATTGWFMLLILNIFRWFSS